MRGLTPGPSPASWQRGAQKFHIQPLPRPLTIGGIWKPKRAGRDRRAIRDWLAGLTEATAYRGVTGAIRFRPNGDPEGKGFVMTQVRNGAMTLAPTEGR